jgi:hypothetical protein
VTTHPSCQHREMRYGTLQMIPFKVHSIYTSQKHGLKSGVKVNKSGKCVLQNLAHKNYQQRSLKFIKRT